MIDAKQIRANPDRLKEIVRLRKVDASKADVDRWLELDKEKRGLQTEIEGLNSEKKKIAGIGKSDPQAARAKGQELREKLRDLDKDLTAIKTEWKISHGVVSELDRSGNARGRRRRGQRGGIRMDT